MKHFANLVDQAESLYQLKKYPEARALVAGVLSKDPANERANVLMGWLLAYSQKEAEALDYAEKAPSCQELHALLVSHFYSRKALAQRLKQKDLPGELLLAQAKKLFPEASKTGIRLSACLIVKNEEAYLEACLASLKGLVDEIVVVDTGSTDGTLEIAKRHGAKIGHTEWNADFAAARNVSLGLATGDWILWIDADEVLTPDSKEKIFNALMRPHFAGFSIPIVNFVSDESEAEQFVHAPVRLFQRLPGVQFSGKIHEQVTPSLESYRLPYATIEGATILHYGYKPSVVESRAKLERTLSILESELKEDPGNSFQWFNLANTFASAERFEEAVNAAERAIETSKQDDQHLRHTYQILADNQDKQGLLEDALATLDKAEARGQGGIQVHYLRATILLKKDDVPGAWQAAQSCLSSEWPVHETGDYTIFTYKRHALAAQILGLMDRFEEAQQQLVKAQKVAPHNSSVRWIGAVLAESLGELQEAAALYQNLTGDEKYGLRAHLALAHLADQLGDNEAAASYLGKAWQLNPEDQDIWSMWVQALEKAGDAPSLLNAYDALSERGIPDAGILVNWGRALLASGFPVRAIDCFSEAIKRDPDDANAYFNCGDALFQDGQYLDAAHLFESGLRRAPQYAQGWFVLGNSLANIGSVDGAKIAYGQCLQIDPQHASALHNLAVVTSAA